MDGIGAQFCSLDDGHDEYLTSQNENGMTRTELARKPKGESRSGVGRQSVERRRCRSCGVMGRQPQLAALDWEARGSRQRQRDL